ncbi:glycoside hydrolase family 47 protein [Dothidotthia symphoricarpi CBS 119687]|uniref:alpha-1,2-Mannosidase n=1 Tax=Dothidotthia symphoricarpi CBS 119687 TaxID=1392245 RepID=A0A6A6A322_9PLEO|nr:glycoside hydrolase family 47 protein [Dothidotthia symphoricarpi CBS 119687]KAF2124981.1 glycoside hydrolase family 47 protein [Dothidotthia symphoricarpi CBS 119687]
MRRIKPLRRATHHQQPPMSRQHQRTVMYLLCGALAFGAAYLWYLPPIDRLAVPFPVHEAYMNEDVGKARLVAKMSYDWRTAPFLNTVEEYMQLPSGEPRALPKVQFDFPPETGAQRRRRERRRVAVRDEFQRSWQSYRRFAWGEDELKPISGAGDETFGGWGATLVDSLDTLWIMGLKEEFYEALEAVAAIDFGKSNMKTISVFETTIRYLGGMLSAYDLSLEPMLLDKAVQLGEMLYRAFDTPNNTPLNWLDIEKAKSADREPFKAETSLCLACLGSLTMEFTRLAQITAEPKYYDAVARITDLLRRKQNDTRLPGLWPITLNAAKHEFNQSRTFTIGAQADSTYEYFPKMAALLGGREPVYEQLYADAAAMIDKHMLFRPMVPFATPGESLLFCGNIHVNDPLHVVLDPEMQHLTCFAGGMFALAGRLFADPHHVELGAKLTRGCVYAYAATPSGIMPETFDVLPCADRATCAWNQTLWEDRVMRHYGTKYIGDAQAAALKHRLPLGFPAIRDRRYLLRPEAIESVFILHRITGEDAYMEYAWDMFCAVVAASRTPFANGQVRDVTAPGGGGVPGVRGSAVAQEDKMESFWTAETLKYFYLVFSGVDVLALDEWVFNTEAHPLRRPGR